MDLFGQKGGLIGLSDWRRIDFKPRCAILFSYWCIG